jgi:O-antigen/teichoic acid export membrane protein
MWFLAVPWAEAWGIHAAVPLVRILGVALFLNSLSSVPLALIQYRLRFGAAALAETVTQITGITVGVLLAVHFHSTVALAVGQVIAAAALLTTTAVLARRDLCVGFDRSESRELLTFGSQVSFLYLGSYASNTIPSWTAGRSFGAFALGLYSRAYLMVGIPLTYLLTSITKVLFPLLGRVRDDTVRTKAVITEGVVLATGFTWPLFAVLAGGASVAVHLLLGSRWHAATPLLQLSVLIACGAFPTGLLTTVAEALGWLRLAALRLITFVALLLTSVAIVESAGLGLKELLVGVAIAQWVTYAITLKPFVSRALVDRQLIIRSHLIHGAVSAGAFIVAFADAHFLGGVGLIAQVAGELVIALAACLPILFCRSWFPASQVLARRLSSAQLSPYTWFGRKAAGPH